MPVAVGREMKSEGQHKLEITPKIPSTVVYAHAVPPSPSSRTLLISEIEQTKRTLKFFRQLVYLLSCALFIFSTLF